MKRFRLTRVVVLARWAAALAALVLVACGTGTSPMVQPSPTAQASPAGPNPYPLSEAGAYYVSMRRASYVDSSRGDRGVDVTVWYPAARPEGAVNRLMVITANLEPDKTGAPYPLIVSSSKVGMQLAPYLVSHGFTWVGVNRIDTYAQANEQMIQQPRDILFALDSVATDPPEGLDGVIDAENAGAIGYSFDAYNALVLAGARIDPAYYLAQCPEPDAQTAAILSDMSAYGCGPADDWGTFVALAGEASAVGEGELWQPISDPRIRAVMPMAGEGWWLFGARGLAAVNRPILMLAATGDTLYPENALIYDHLGSPDKAFISVIGLDHLMIFKTDAIQRMAHFATAFFGYHLQGREALAAFFSEAFVAQHTDLAWGIYQGE